MADQLLYRPEEAGRVLRMSRAAIYQKLANGELASVKIGRSRRITRDELEAYVRRLTGGCPGAGGYDGDAA